MYLIEILLHDGIFGLVTAIDLIGDKLRIAISLKSTGTQPVCDLEAGNQGLILGFMVGGMKVETKGVGNFHKDQQ